MTPLKKNSTITVQHEQNSRVITDY